MRRTYFIICILIFSALAESCAPTKNTATRRFYHNLVSRYNIYYNGKESMRQAQLQLSTNHKDDYTRVLDLLKYGTDDDVAGITPLMERSSEKGSKVVFKHSMNFGGVEYNRWIDDSYMMIGKSRFFKRDYLAAIEMFDFVAKRFTKDPIRFDAMLWMAKSYMFSGRYSRCDAVFGMIEPAVDKNETSKYVKSHFPIVKAQYLIMTDNLEEAARYLDKALKTKQKRKTKMRLLFVAGQVNQRLGKEQVALQHYQACIRMNPPYVMAFHAKIYSAECYDAASGGGENILKELHKMLKDSKNKDYFDVIYYALANIELKNNNIPKAVEFFKLSAKSSISNDLQKSLSYRKLAEIHFDMKKYRDSKFYYDSTLAALPQKHQDYAKIEKKSKILTELIDNLLTIELEDSLQKLAGMSERDRLAVVDNLIANLIRAEEEEKEKERQRQLAAMQQQDPNMQLTNAPGSAWYFYNPSAVNYGRTEFLRMWGERKLEDMWRLANKEAAVFSDYDEIVEDLDPETADSIAKLNNPKDRAYYLKNIPDTPEKIEKSNQKIELAHYKAATVYKDDLKDYVPATQLFEELLRRFPKTEFELRTYYNLYLIAKSTNNIGNENKYKDLILSKYPDSDIARIINDPDYYKNIALQADEVKLAYKRTWEMYNNKQYASVIESADSAIAKYKDPVHLPKFEYLKAVSLVKTSGTEAMIVQLEHLISNYPNSDVKPLAEQLLKYVKGDDDYVSTTDGSRTDGSNAKAPLYKPSSESFHLFVLILDVKTTKLNNVKISVADHNTVYHSTQGLTVSTLFLNDKRHMVTVSRFSNQTEGERYVKTFMSNTELLKSIENDFPIYFIISTENYPVFYKDKDEQAYLEFYRRYYMQK